ncbi:5 -AMP-activated kinase subunit beta-1 family protein [Babesia ovata]|uniref:5-AMP-activated kinase subunit beta-1 family protein n=1 Tax=Babesia ovata TaxID=189622 RepID=A0A2H6KA00_9APIC|nr:5 -AMP-activated kinase subunit beta-1 family protein [Babesia ovata]GBE59816.1 5 -AMP-activated kinase subunit beta-1 family protein [Babesia ovata]
MTTNGAFQGFVSSGDSIYGHAGDSDVSDPAAGDATPYDSAAFAVASYSIPSQTHATASTGVESLGSITAAVPPASVAGAPPTNLKTDSVFEALRWSEEIAPYFSDIRDIGNWVHPEPPAADKVTAVFNWNHGGKEVYLICKEDGETKRLRMYRNGNSFMLVRDVPKALIEYTFLVDGIEQCAPDQPFQRTADGVKNVMDCVNVLRVESVVAADEADPFEGYFDQSLPDRRYMAQEAQVVPNALLYRSPNFRDGDRVGNDIHVMANHIYEDTMSDDVLGRNYRSYTNIYCWETSSADISLSRNSASVIYITRGPHEHETESEVQAQALKWFNVTE